MLEKGKISNSQFTLLLIMFLIGSSTVVLPTILTGIAKQDAWLSTVIGIGFGVLFSLIYAILAARYPNLSLAEYSEKILGKWLGKTVSVLFFLYLLMLTSRILRITVDLILTHILPETPIQAIEALFILIVIMGVRLGLETFARTAEMLFPYIILFILTLTLLLLDEVKMETLLPLLENGFMPVLRGAYRTMGAPFLDLVVFLIIAPYVTKPEKVGRNLISATLIGGAILTLVMFLSITILGTELSARSNFPTYILAQKVEVGNFLERIEVLSGGLIFISLFIKLTICFYSMVLSLAQTLQLNSYKPLTFPLGLLVMMLSIFLFPNIIYFRDFITNTWTPIVILYGLIIPLFLLTVDTIRNGFNKSKVKDN